MKLKKYSRTHVKNSGFRAYFKSINQNRENFKMKNIV
jgi:hypothetical protein